MAGTVSNEPRLQYADSVEGGTILSAFHIREIKDFMPRLTRQDIVLSKLFETGPAPERPMLKHEWSWGEPDPWEGSLAVAIVSTDQPTFTAADGSIFQIADRIIIDAEEMYVTGIEGNVVEVDRGFAGTTPATHLINTAIFILGPAIVEHADDPDSVWTQGNYDYNYCQIMDFTWSMSARAEVTPNWGRAEGNAYDQEMRRKMEDTAPLRMEITYLTGHRSLGSGVSPSTMGGLDQTSFFTWRNDLSGAVLEFSDLEDLAEDIFMSAGSQEMPNMLMTSHFGWQIISSWFNDSRVSTVKDDSINLTWKEIETHFGTIRVTTNYIMNRVAPDTMYLFNPKMFKKKPYATGFGWHTGSYYTQGWYRRGFLRSDSTLIAQGPDWRGALTGFSTTRSDYGL